MRYAWVLLTVGVTVLTFGPVGARGADDDAELRLLRAENKVLKANLEQQDKKIAELQEEIRALKAGPDQAEVEKLRRALAEARAQIKALSKQPPLAPPAKDEKKVVLPAQEFKALPVFTARFGNYIDPLVCAVDGTPMGFASTKMNGVGYVDTGEVLRIVDDSTAIVGIVLVELSTNLSPANNGRVDVVRAVIIEGVPTKGQADNSPWTLRSWFKIVDTRELDGATYFVAWPIVQADKGVRPARKDDGKK